VATGPRFLTLADVAEILNTTVAQVKALVSRKELRALQIGGRGQWRIEISELESFIERMYVQAEQNLDRKGSDAGSARSETPQRSKS
jgi:excisionase family DNA binding protein